MVMKNSDKSKEGRKGIDADFSERLKGLKDPKLRKLLEDQIRLGAESRARIEKQSKELQEKSDEDLNRLERETAERRKKREEIVKKMKEELDASIQKKKEESARLVAEVKEQERRKTEQFNKEYGQLKVEVEQQIIEKKGQAQAESAQINTEIEQKRQETRAEPEENYESIMAELVESRDAKLDEEVKKITKGIELRELESEAQREVDLKIYRETGNTDHIGKVIVKMPDIPEINNAYSLTYDRKGPGFMAAVKERIVPIGVAACIMISAANFAYKKVPSIKTFVDSTIYSMKHTETVKPQLATKAPEEKTHEAKASKSQVPSFIKDYRAHLQEFIASMPRTIYKNISTVIHGEKSDEFEIITRMSYPQDAVSAETVNKIVEGIYRETGKKVKVYTNINLGIGAWVVWNGEKAETKWIGEIGCGAPTPDTLSPIGISKLGKKLANKPFIVINARDFKGFKDIPGFHIDEKGLNAYFEPDSAGNLLGPAKVRLDRNDGCYMLTLGRSCCAPWLASYRTLDAGAERGLTRGAKESTTLGCIYIAYYKTYIYTGGPEDFLKGKFKQQITEGKFREAREGEEIPLKDGSAGSLRKVASGMPGELRIYDKEGNPVNFESVDWTKAPKLTYLPIDPAESEFFKNLNPGDLVYIANNTVLKNGRGFIVLAGRYDSVNGISKEASIKRAKEELEALGMDVSIDKIKEAVKRANEKSTGYWITEIS